MGFRTSKFMTGMKSKKAFKTLSVAALAGCALFSSSAFASDITTNDIYTTYGTGDSAKYYKWGTDSTTGNTILVESIESEAQISVNYDSLNLNTRLENTTDISSTPLLGNFIAQENKLDTNAYGGAIENRGTIGDISSDFLFNSAKSTKYSHGGAIWNQGVIGNVTGNFIANYLECENSGTQGGAIYNTGDIGNIESNFIGNYLNNSEFSAYGSVIYNSNGTIGDISGDFIGNYTKNDKNIENYVSFGVIYNTNSSIGNISGNFINNYVISKASEGGVLYNDDNAIVGDISGYFEKNYIIATSTSAAGGVIYNDAWYPTDEYGEIGDINADFVGNYVQATSSSAEGGTIYNSAIIGNITGNYIGNFATGQGESSGGAIFNYATGTIGDINSSFEKNYAEGGTAYGGAIYNAYRGINSDWVKGSITSINGKFVENYVIANDIAYGGAIYNQGTIGIITADFVGNYAKTNAGMAQGGAIYIGVAQQTGVVDASELPYMEIVILNDDGTVYKSFAQVTDSNGNNLITQDALKEAIKQGTLTSFVKIDSFPISKAEFDAMCEQEGMTEEEYFAMIEQESGGTLIYGDPNDLFNVLDEEGTTIAIIERQTLDSARTNKASVTLKNSNILNNFALSENGEAKGGAIYLDYANVKIEANDGQAHLISGNYTKNGDVVDDNAIYAKNGKVIFDVTNGSTIQLDDNINGENYETFIIGDQQSNFVLNNKIKNSTTHLVETNLYLTKDSHLDGNNLGLHSGTLHMINNQAGVSALNSLTVTGDTNVNVDVDLKNQTMDRFTASEYGSHSGNLNVTGMNLLSDAVSDKTEILFAEQGLKDNVTNGITSQLPDDKYQTTLFTPIYKYNVSYDNREDAGYFVFTRPTTGGSTGGAPSVDTFNPAVLGSSTSATVGATATMNQAFNYAFQNSADYMNIPYLERISMRDRNKYAISVTGDATDMGRFSPLYQPSQEGASVWVKPYATFETVGLKNGPKVHNNTYGTLVGFDTEMQHLKRGWDRVFTGYIGYNGASQRYSGIDSTQNGGLLGGTMTLYKGNFFNATTVSVGASVANNQTMYGNEDFAMLLSGIGNKTGYNFEFKEGKLILQPSMLMSYTFVNTFDYTNAAGVRIDNKPLHALQLAPGVKVIGNLKGGWQPYASVQMVWNLMGESNATANGVKLPEMSIKPYVQYGVGVQKRIKDHFTAYGQAMVQNGGRNGVSLTAGFRWALGHDNCKYKVEDKQLRGKAAKQLRGNAAKQLRGNADKSKCHYEERSDVVISSNNAIATPLARNDKGRKILKQMTPQQRAAYGGKYYNTTRTAKAGSLRQY